MKVLLVEDDPATIESIQLCIEMHYPEATIVSTEHGLEAVTLLKANHFDIALVDLGLPDIDGLEMVREIRRLSNAPIMIISARYNLESINEARAAGANHYLPKPFDFHLLTKRLAEIDGRPKR